MYLFFRLDKPVITADIDLRGPINTPMLRGALAKLGLESLPGPAIPRIAESEEVANLVAFLLSDDSKFISGTDLSIDGAWCC